MGEASLTLRAEACASNIKNLPAPEEEISNTPRETSGKTRTLLIHHGSCLAAQPVLFSGLGEARGCRAADAADLTKLIWEEARDGPRHFKG